jgi:predicted amidophosphoribosyltransferase
VNIRPLRLALHHGTKSKLARLKKDAEHEGAFRVAKRFHAVLLNAEDYKSGTIAQILDAPLSKVSEWLRNYEQYGY